MIKVSGLIHNRAKPSDIRLDLLMIKNTHLMHREINNTEESNSEMIFTSMFDNIQSNKKCKIEDSWGKAENSQYLLQKINTPSDLN